MTISGWIRREHAPHDTAAPVVAVRNMGLRYDRADWVLEDITLDLARGERLAIVGPNGAGKSTLMKVIAGILPATTGTVEVYGNGAGGHICIGYVPQRTLVDWNFPVTVSDVVMMGRIAKLGLLRHAGRRDWQLVRESLEQVGMASFADRQIGELSGGQQQRVFIARSLAQEAELLLMDEPLTGLDIPSQEAIFEVLDLVRARQMTVLLSTHDLQLAADKFDRLMLLNRRVIGLGTAREALTPEKLRQAYGGHMTLIEMPEGALVVGDTCCEGHEEEGEHVHA